MTTRTIEQPVAATGHGGYGLEHHGLEPAGEVHWNLSPARLYEESLRRGDGHVVHMGAIATVTAPHTGRSPNDRFVVRDEVTEDVVDWGNVNVRCRPSTSTRSAPTSSPTSMDGTTCTCVTPGPGPTRSTA
jgi:phosphoenolpyruvate carboxykinase (ATP)